MSLHQNLTALLAVSEPVSPPARMAMMRLAAWIDDGLANATLPPDQVALIAELKAAVERGEVNGITGVSVADGAITLTFTDDTTFTTPDLRVPGPPGPAPAHQWDGTALAFRNPDGSLGQAVDLRGAAGKDAIVASFATDAEAQAYSAANPTAVVFSRQGL